MPSKPKPITTNGRRCYASGRERGERGGIVTMPLYERVARRALRIALQDELDALFTGPNTDVLYRLKASAWDRECLVRRTLADCGDSLQQGGGTFDDFGAAVESLRGLVAETLRARSGAAS